MIIWSEFSSLQQILVLSLRIWILTWHDGGGGLACEICLSSSFSLSWMYRYTEGTRLDIYGIRSLLLNKETSGSGARFALRLTSCSNTQICLLACDIDFWFAYVGKPNSISRSYHHPMLSLFRINQARGACHSYVVIEARNLGILDRLKLS
jgi:hypothetical protein